MQTQAMQESDSSVLKSCIVAQLSHEIRSPLNTILLSAKLLERYEHKFSDEKKREYLHCIQAAVQQVNQLLNHSLQNFDPGPVCQERSQLED